MDNQKPGCLSGLLKLFLLDKLFDWLQEKFGYKSGSCMGVGCGVILTIIFILLVLSVCFGTQWTRLSF